MSRLAQPYTLIRRKDSKSFRLTINTSSGLPPSVCKEWYRRSFQYLPTELADYRNPKSKPAADAGAKALILYLSKKMEKVGLAQRSIVEVPTGKFAKDMFTDGAAHIRRWIEKGYVLKPQTIVQHRRHLKNYIIPGFGEVPLDKIRPAKVEDFLLEQPLANSSRNGILYTLQLIMQEAKREGIIDMVPEFEPFKRNSRRQDVLSSEELDMLFPDDEKELIGVWKRPDDMRMERDEIALMFGTLFCIAVSAGMRSGEIRALFTEQVSLPNSGLLIDRAVDDMGVIGSLSVKKATEENPRSRAVVIPGKSNKESPSP